MSIWAWVYDSLRSFRRAQEMGDAERGKLVGLYHDVLQEPLTLLYSDPDRALARLDEGRAVAERLGESWWVLLLDHWRIRALQHMGNYSRAHDIAVRAIVEAHKPAYRQLPQRICLELDGLVSIHMATDPEWTCPGFVETCTLGRG